MNINDDPGRRVVLDTGAMAWVPSPMAGVDRRMLDRTGGEVARATSIVRYAPRSRFSRHVHGGGEEILVLDGVFSDEHGHNPRGAYLRNPPGTAHAPFSEEGCIILVKLWQFASGDTAQIALDTLHATWQPDDGEGLESLPLHAHGGVRTSLVRCAPARVFVADRHAGGVELLVLEGALHDGQGDYPAGTWLRSPVDVAVRMRAGPEGAVAFVKTGHLDAQWLPLPR